MEEATLDSPPLTLGELSELLNRHIENVLIAKLIKDAMQRRLPDASHERPMSDVTVSMPCSGPL